VGKWGEWKGNHAEGNKGAKKLPTDWKKDWGTAKKGRLLHRWVGQTLYTNTADGTAIKHKRKDDTHKHVDSEKRKKYKENRG